MAKGLDIFVVDDDAMIVKLLTSVLEGAGHKVASETDSTKALAQVIETTPDCVMIDLMMPGLDGLEFCRRMRAEKTLDDTKIIIVTGKAYEVDKKRAFEFGADGYVTKPINPDTLIGLLDRILANEVELTFWDPGWTGVRLIWPRRAVKY